MQYEGKLYGKVNGKFIPLKNTTADLRTAVADYMHSEGCSCCQDVGAHKEHEAKLAKLLNVPAYSDNSGYDFSIFRTKKNLNP